MGSGKKILKVLLPVILLLVGLSVLVGLVSSRKAPRKAEKRETGALVRVMEAKRVSHRIILSATGTARPSRSVTVIPEVSGRLKFVSDSLVQGGLFPEGKVLVKVEDVDYRLNIERAGAAMATAEFELAKIESEARVARNVWSASGVKSTDKENPNPLVVYTPQLKNARAGLASARAAYIQEQVNLERTVLRAPFNSIVRSESVELGQYVRSGTEVATLIGTDDIEIVVPLKVDDLRWIVIPEAGSDTKGSRATVSMETGGQSYIWKGRVVRSLAEVDPGGRMMRVVVRVEDPYGLKSKKRLRNKSKPPLAVGSFVGVEIEGGKMDGVFVVSRSALRDNSTVWTVGEDSNLKIRSVTPVRIESETVIIKEGLSDGIFVVTTDLSGAADGMKLRTLLGGDAGTKSQEMKSIKEVAK